MLKKPNITAESLATWQRIVDLAARIVDVPSCLIMRTELPEHAVLVANAEEGNAYRPGQTFELNPKLYCYDVLQRRSELVVRNAHVEADWSDNQDLEHGMSFYVGYPIVWPDGTLFGTLCVLDRRVNEKALLHRDLLKEYGLQINRDLALLCEVARREQLEVELLASLDELEVRVAERTGSLMQAVGELRQRERQLEDANTALRVLVSQVDESRRASEAEVLRQIRELVLPHIAQIRQITRSNSAAQAYVDIVESNLRGITSAFAGKLASVFERLTPTEAEIAQLVLTGRSTKEIANALSREPSTIDFHRHNIRRKLGLSAEDGNLRHHLRSLV